MVSVHDPGKDDAESIVRQLENDLIDLKDRRRLLTRRLTEARKAKKKAERAMRDRGKYLLGQAFMQLSANGTHSLAEVRERALASATGKDKVAIEMSYQEHVSLSAKIVKAGDSSEGDEKLGLDAVSSTSETDHSRVSRPNPVLTSRPLLAK